MPSCIPIMSGAMNSSFSFSMSALRTLKLPETFSEFFPFH